MEKAATDITIAQVETVFNLQRKCVAARRSEPVRLRKERIRKIGQWIKSNRQKIHEALYADLHKPTAESDATEILPALTEVQHTITHLEDWVKPKKVDAPLTMLGTRSVIRYEPKGVCLIISPWNYPFNLAIGPLISALAAGNTAVIKPSEYAPHTSSLIRQMAEALFEKDEVAVFEGGPGVSQQLLTLPFDHIFFTGSPAVGKIVMKAAAEHLASVTLELGGKSPAVVLPSASVKVAARRIAVAKFINNGQTCLAPDYVLVHESQFESFVAVLKAEVLRLFAENGKPLQASPHYARIINRRHFERLHQLVEDAVARGARPELSGAMDASQRFLHPIILCHVPDDALLMQEEIFGPVLPVRTYKNIAEVLNIVNSKPKPLALYIFGTDAAERNRIITETSSGAVCVNDCAIHFLHINLPFGGVNHSGIGKAHGFYGFQAFSNEKPVLVQRSGITTVSFFYPPYNARVKKLTEWIIRLF